MKIPLSRPAGVAVCLFFLFGLADGVLMPFFALWAQRVAGVPTALVGLLLGCYAGGELLATPLVGGIADRIGRRPVLLFSTGGIGAGFLLLHLAHGPVAAGSVLLTIGAFESVLHPTAAAVLTDVLPSARSRRAFALTRTASAAGHVAGPAVGALLAARSLGSVFLGPAAAMLAATAMIALLLPETVGRRGGAAGPEDHEDEDDVTALLALFRNRRLAALLLPAAVLDLASSWIEAVLPLYAAETATLTPSGIGLLFSWSGIVGTVLQLPVAGLSVRIGDRASIAAGGALMLLAFGSLILSAAIPSLVFAVTLGTVASVLTGPLVQAITADLAPATARATYMAAFSATQDLQDAAGPATGTALFAAAATLPWLLGMPMVLGASLVLAVIAHRHDGRTSEA